MRTQDQRQLLHEETMGDTSPVVSRMFSWPTFANISPAIWCTWAILAGLLARYVRFAGGWPIWGDEAALAENLFNRDYWQLTQPLSHGQVSPILYTWTIKLCSQWFGFNVLGLRLPALISGLGALLMVSLIARMIKNGETNAPLRWLPWWSVALLSVSHSPIRYSAEIKQYSTDSFVAAIMVWLALRAHPQPNKSWSAADAIVLLLIPVLMFASLPAVFVACGIVLLFAVEAIRGKTTQMVVRSVLFAMLVGSIFWVINRFLMANQYLAHQHLMTHHWQRGFIPLELSPKLAWWLVDVLGGHIFGYPIGADYGATAPFAFLFWVGVWQLYRHTDRRFLIILSGTMMAGLFAAGLHKYPFGQHPRVMQYTAPLICLTMGAGLSWLAQIPVNWLKFPANMTWQPAIGVILVLAGLTNAMRDIARPTHLPAATATRDFNRWLWKDHAHENDIICATECVLNLNEVPSDAIRQLDFDLCQYRWHRKTMSPKSVKVMSDLSAVNRLNIDKPTIIVVATRLTAPTQSAIEQFEHHLTKEFGSWRATLMTVNCQSIERVDYLLYEVGPSESSSPKQNHAKLIGKDFSTR